MNATIETSASVIRHIDDEDVQEAARKAVSAACNELDALFPGGDGGGVCTNFAGLLEKTILRMLSGEDPTRGYSSTWLPELVLTDRSFGDPCMKGELFVVTCEDGHDFVPPAGAVPPVAPATEAERAHYRRRHIDGYTVPRVLVLSWDGQNFTRLQNTEAVNPCTSFTAAAREAIAWLRRNGTTQGVAKLKVRPVKQTTDAYAFADA